jgi:hypothetical protein
MKSGEIANVTLENGLAEYEPLCKVLRRHSPSHLSCVSVLEHASYPQQRGIFDAIETEFSGECAVFTFEFHETKCHFAQQLTTKTLSEAVSGLRRYYLDETERAPMHCVNAVTESARLWYPLALRFARAIDDLPVHVWQKRALPASFDPDRYLEMNPDVASSGFNAEDHYLAHGWKEGRRWS